MRTSLRQDADVIISEAIAKVKPDEAVRRALKDANLSGNVYIVAVGKAAYQMAYVAASIVDYKSGVVVTKYHHVLSEIERMSLFEAGHPIPDEKGIEGTKAALDMTANLTSEDTVLFLLSGGGSALFESPLIPLDLMQDITSQLLSRGADITEINTIRKRLSMVKGGKFAEHVKPAKIYSVILSDIIGDPVDMIASGPTVADSSTSKQALEIIEKYEINVSEEVLELLKQETPKSVINATNVVIGSVRELCNAALVSAQRLGYDVTYLSDSITCEAKALGSVLGSIAESYSGKKLKKAFVCGGETIVNLTGKGIGGRNQEIAAASIRALSKTKNACVFSVGSDGTDGPTDAAGGYADSESFEDSLNVGIDIDRMQSDNDCYNLLKAVNGLVITGPTGTNVNDFSMVLIDED